MSEETPRERVDARLGAHTVRAVVYDEATIRARVAELGRDITAGYPDEVRLLVVGTLKGSCLFLADLVREIRRPVEIDFLAASSYGAGTTSTGDVRLVYGPTVDLTGRTVLLVEDIVDSGATLAYLVPRLASMGADAVDVCALLHKRAPTATDKVRFVGFDAPNSFLVGYGLDHAEDFRHLPYIASL